MISEVQREALSTLAEVLAFSPEIRLGQLMAHLGFLGECHLGRDLSDLEDEELLSMIEKHRTELLNRESLVSASN